MYQQLSQTGRDLIAEVACELIPTNKAFCLQVLKKSIAEGRVGVANHLIALMQPTELADIVNTAIVEGDNATLVFYILGHSSLDPSTDCNKFIKTAAAAGRTDIVRILLNDPRVDPGDQYQYAIGFAALNGHTETVSVLLTHPNVDPAGDHNFALLRSCENGHAEVAKLLFSDPRVAKCADEHYRILLNCVSKNNAKGVRILLDLLPKINSGILTNAVHAGYTEIVNILLQCDKIDRTHDNYEAFKYACGSNLEILKAFEKYNLPFDVYCKGLVHALRWGEKVNTEYLVSRVNIYPKPYGALQVAIDHNNPTYVSMILRLIEADEAVIAMVKASPNKLIRELAPDTKVASLKSQIAALESKIADQTRQLTAALQLLE
jgi:hypothetical protein